MRIKLLFFTIILLYASNAIGGTIRHDVEDDKYIEYGKQQKCVVRIICKKNDKVIKFGSGVIIRPNWVATAAHLIDDDFSVFVSFQDKEIKMKNVFTHPDFLMSKRVDDIAVCQSEEALELDFYPELYKEKDELGKACIISGFGITGTGLTGCTNRQDDRKRAGSNFVEEVSDKFLYCIMDKEKPSPLEYCIAAGDSGGGLFINKKLAGINHAVLAKDKTPDSNYGDESGHIRISFYRPWIEKVIRENEP